MNGPKHIMKISEPSQELILHHVYTYSDSDFSTYKKKKRNSTEEQIELGEWVNQLVSKNPQDRELGRAADRFFKALAPLAAKKYWFTELQQDFLASRLGVRSQVLKEHPDLEQFISANYLHKHMLYHGHKIELSANGEPLLLVEGSLTPWSTFRYEVELDAKNRLKNYYYTYEGFVAGQPDETFRVFKKVKPTTYRLEIVSVRNLPPHSWIRLIDSSGDLYSAGLWGVTPMGDLWSAITHLVPESGRLLSPDIMEVVVDPADMITTSIELSKEQFDTLFHYLIGYQKNPSQYEVLGIWGGENCAVFVKGVLQQIGIEMSASSWKRPFANPYDIMDWQKERRQKPPLSL